MLCLLRQNLYKCPSRVEALISVLSVFIRVFDIWVKGENGAQRLYFAGRRGWRRSSSGRWSP